MQVRAVAAISVMTPLIMVMTMLIRVPIPATQGYFNFGDSAVILVSMLFGSYVGLVAGGLGSALADVLSNYTFYAPITFVAKGLEGLVVGVAFGRLKERSRLLSYLCGPVGGVFMISSYFVFDYVFYGLGGALSELPFNIFQVIFGSIIAYVLYNLVHP
ncbi:MAG: ECF transporter S component [Nitrososphaeria archaeon]